MDTIDKKLENAIKGKIRVIYSAYDTDEDDEPIDNLDEIAVEGKAILFKERDEYWGGKKSQDYRSEVLENPTWLDVCVCANTMIKTTRDGHHVFLEGLEFENKDGDVSLYRFVMGS